MSATMDIKLSAFQGVTFGKKLGSGSFGSVFVGLLEDGRFVAIKQLEYDEELRTRREDGSAKEIDVHSKLIHPHIIRYLHSAVDDQQSPPKLNLYLEFVTGGSVTSIMKTLPDNHLPLTVARVYSRHLFLGLDYLHQNGIAHRDIKGDNLLISQDTGVAKLADFDQATVMFGPMRATAAGGTKKASTLAGTPYWIAPEVITEEGGYNPFKADVWSAACTVAEMITGKAPWQPMSNPMGIMFKLANSFDWPDAISKDEMKAHGQEVYEFLDACFRKEAEKRPSCAELLSYPFLSQVAEGP